VLSIVSITLRVLNGKAPAAAASWRAHDGGRQWRTACPPL
jgi:hypothetical protein